MKQILTSILLLATTMVMAQHNAITVSFEDPNLTQTPWNGQSGGCTMNPPVENDPVDNNYFLCAYNITFHEGTLTGPPPLYVHVGPPDNGFVNGNGLSYSSVFGCTVNTSDAGDKPSDNAPGAVAVPGFIFEDLGCFFMSTNIGGNSIFVKYHNNVGCMIASGTLLDVDVEEAWHMIAYDNSGAVLDQMVIRSNSCTSCATFPPGVPVTVAPTGDGKTSVWSLTSNSQPIDHIEFRSIGDDAGFAFDNFHFCSSNTVNMDIGCCEGQPNLIENGGFFVNAPVNSGYAHESTIVANSVGPGEYAIVNSSQALTISDQWVLSDHSTCPDDHSNFLVVNGRTMGSGSTMVYQTETMDLQGTDDEEYIFCMYYQHLPQCAFDVFDVSNIIVEFEGATGTPVNGCEEGGTNCGWTRLSYKLVPDAESGGFSVAVFVDETNIGDGNDVAFDDFSIQQRLPVDVSLVKFGSVDFYPNSQSTFYNKTATAVTLPVPFGYTVTWTVDVLDCGSISNPTPTVISSYSDPNWDGGTTNFPGYGGALPGNPGIFDDRVCYRITRTLSNCCSIETSWSKTFQNNSNLPVMIEGVDGGVIPVENVTTDDHGNLVPVPYTKGNQERFGIYPNPGFGQVTIESSEELNGSRLLFYNADGAVVKDQMLNSDGTSARIDISNLSEGIYSVELKLSSGTIQHQKFVKQ